MDRSSDDPTRSHVWEEATGQPVVIATWDGGTLRKVVGPDATCIIGRGEECDLRIVHPSLSRRHVAIHLGANPRVEDLGSTNGTRVGYRLLRGESAPLGEGTLIEVGPALVVVQLPSLPSLPETRTMTAIARLIDLVAKGNLSILLFGETGVGKEVAADRIHAMSSRSAGPHIKVNCAALSGPLLESELFGHERGAFTGADRQKLGLLEAANRGTVFLDEIAEVPLETQAALLRVLENKEVRRVGGVVSTAIDVRFVAATNRDLRARVRSGAFREDLYYRLNGITVQIPPLRERMDELPGLVSAIVNAHAPGTTVDRDALQVLARHPWPGNIRELRNVLHRAVALADGENVQVGHLMFDASDDNPGGSNKSLATSTDLVRELKDIERQRVIDALQTTDGNQTKAAHLLGITRRALIVRLDSYDLPRPRRK